jgi:hypothetical protein
MARTILKLAINLFLLLLSAPAMASIGSITEFQGAGQIKRTAAAIPAARGSGIEKNDTVLTTSHGRFKITFVDATTVSITENSKLLIDDFVFSGGGGSKGRLGLKVALGTVRYASGAIAHSNPSGVNIRTPTATIGVRGTDFLMSVDETGKTTVILLPNCFDDKDPTKITTDCPTGSIEVLTASGVVTLSQPFQATMVENSFTPPAPPVKVNMTMKQVNNSLQISSPTTLGGESLAKVSKSAALRALNPSQAAADNNQNPDTNSDRFEEVTAALATRQNTPDDLARVYLEENGELPRKPIHTNVSPVLNKKLIQVGWAYSLLSPDKLQAATVWLPKNTEVIVTVVQNGVIDSYNFMNQKWTNQGDGRPQGSITIIQNGAPPK